MSKSKTPAILRVEHVKIIKQINKYINKLYKTDNVFGIECLHNSSNPNPINIFLMPGYNNGLLDAELLWNDEELRWISQLISILDLNQVNLYLLHWKSTGLKYVTASRTILSELYHASFPGSYHNAELTGYKLAKFLDIFNPKGNNKVVLIGHSLGSKIILSCLSELFKMGYSKKQKYPIVDLVILLGSTEFTNKVDTNKISQATVHKSINVYSTDDKILKYIVGFFYQMSLFNIYNVVGLGPLSRFYNLNSTKLLNSVDKKRCKEEKKCKDIGYGHDYSSIIWWIFSHKIISQYNLIPLKN
jgi:hypothetical protein